MKKKITALVIVVLSLITVVSTGCTDKGELKDGKPNEVDDSISPLSGWLDSSGDGPPWPVDSTLKVNLNETSVISAEFTIRIEDSDAEHSETDEGGEPDEVEVYVSGPGGRSDTLKGETPFTQTIEVPMANTTSDEEGSEYIGSDWEVHIHADCYSKKNPTGPGGMVPIFFLEYIDQGVAYNLEVTYTYEETEEK